VARNAVKERAYPVVSLLRQLESHFDFACKLAI
jgi:hypothetical protein